MSELVKSVEFTIHRISGVLRVFKRNKPIPYIFAILVYQTTTDHYSVAFETAKEAEDAAWAYVYELAEEFDYDNSFGMEFDDE